MPRCAYRQPTLANGTDSTENDCCAETANASLANKALCAKRRCGSRPTSSSAKSQRSSDCNDYGTYSSSQSRGSSRNWTKGLKQSDACNSKDPVSNDEAASLDKPQLFNGTPIAEHGKRLLTTFFDQPCVELARNLLGKNVIRICPDGKRLSGRIVETEGYVGTEDRASHSYGGRRTARNEAMYMPPGTSYVYNIYGIYTCMNISSRGKQRVYPVVTFVLVKSLVWQMCHVSV